MQPTEELMSLLFSVSRRMQQHCHKDSRSLVALATLQYAMERGTPTMKDLSSFLGVTPSSATSLVNGLVENGLLERLPCTEDRRVIRVKVTPHGERDVATHVRTMEARLKAMFASLDPNDISELTRIFRQVAATKETAPRL